MAGIDGQASSYRRESHLEFRLFKILTYLPTPAVGEIYHSSKKWETLEIK